MVRSGLVWSGLVPADWSSPLLLCPAGHQQTSAKITAARCFPSSLDVWFSASSQTSSWALWRWRGFHSERRPAALTGPAAENSPDTTEAGPASGRHVLTMSQRCPVLSVLVVRTLCYILVLYKWWSTCRASTPPQDHLMSRASTDGRNIPEVVRRSLCQQRRWLQGCFTPVYSGLDVVLFFKLFLNRKDFLQHFSVFTQERKNKRKQKAKVFQHCFLIYLHQVLEDVFVLNVPRMTQRSNSRKDYLNLSFKLQLWCRMESAK